MTIKDPVCSDTRNVPGSSHSRMIRGHHSYNATPMDMSAQLQGNSRWMAMPTWKDKCGFRVVRTVKEKR